MRLRPANIRLINRRKSYLDRYSLYLRNANNPCNPTSKSTARINKKGLTVHSISETLKTLACARTEKLFSLAPHFTSAAKQSAEKLVLAGESQPQAMKRGGS